jgi:hypothetical protein
MRFLEGRLVLLEFFFETLETLSCLGGGDGGLLGLLARLGKGRLEGFYLLTQPVDLLLAGFA